MVSGALFPQLKGCWPGIYEVGYFIWKFSLILKKTITENNIELKHFLFVHYNYIFY